MKKSDIANALGAKYDYSSYLEISTPTTGAQHTLIDRDRYRRCERAVYFLNEGTEPDPDITYGSIRPTSSEIVASLLPGQPFDLVFADPHHTYENSFEDIVGAFSLVRPGGAIVVHDCNPTSPSIAARCFTEGEWCGVTYWAYINFLLGRPGILFYTVDTDYGCGVVFKSPGEWQDTSRLEFEWASHSWDDEERYAFFDRNRRRLLNLISPEQFARRVGGLPAGGAPT